MTITEIENLTYDQAIKMAEEVKKIKEHDCLFVEIDDGFGYSILVFKNGKHIYYANDYELHHGYLVKEKGKTALRDYYIEEMNNKLYTDAELLEPIKSYYEYEKKSYFLLNYWIMRYDYLSAFTISKEDKKKLEDGKKSYPFFNPNSFCYVKDKEIINTQTKYIYNIKTEYKKLKENNDTFREMISYELANYEACITCSYEETLEALGLRFEELSEEKQKIVMQELKKQINSYNC